MQLDSPIEYLKGVGPARGDLLKAELKIFNFKDLLFHFPFRYVDRTQFQLIKDLDTEGMIVQIKGILIDFELVKGKHQSRLAALFKDESGFLELVWFKGVKWVQKTLKAGEQYIIFGKLNIYKGKKSIAHPELELIQGSTDSIRKGLDPVYPSTEKLTSKGLDSKGIRNIISNLIKELKAIELEENLPEYLVKKLKLLPRFKAIQSIHFPSDTTVQKAAEMRLKFEELFYLQLFLLHNKKNRHLFIKGHTFEKVGDYFNRFYHENLKFELTAAQKRVIKEIRADMGSSHQMNRLLQGDVGSGKTIVGLLCMLIALDNGFQSCLMAPTEILAMQHYKGIKKMVEGLGIRIAFLSGSIKGNTRKETLKMLKEGDIHIIIGTHALIEDPVVFKNLGFAITDEQHRFGVMQRAKLWAKSKVFPPHILVMTATPIPRTLAMTIYGDLDVSIIDEMPPGRKEVKTIHRTDTHRPQIIAFMHQQIESGRQIYVVFPLIEESETLDLQNLQMGYEQLLQHFPPQKFQISVVHGRMKAAEKDFEMDRFVKGITQIMVATTVIEVGVNVPNASVMVIENSERFGLSQLHQLRGRVGRGADQSYCLLVSSYKLSHEARKRIDTMVRTNNGFEIAEADMELRGAGNIYGTQQSGQMDFRIANLATDQKILQTARHIANQILDIDPELKSPQNLKLKDQIKHMKKFKHNLDRIS